jgi:UDP-N-acetylglucosamine/UDP-N-acetylgalactosamine diphosphorylase
MNSEHHIDYQSAYEKLKSIHQQHLLDRWGTLSPTQQQTLLFQIDRFNTATYRWQLETLNASKPIFPFDPFKDYSIAGNPRDLEMVKKLIAEGKMGCLIVAGGQGTRLGYNGPKGMFPTSFIKHKSLYQIFAEKVSAASKQAGRALPLAIMTSPLNHEDTIRFFRQKKFFGLQDNQVTFFSQEMLPFLDKDGNLFLDQSGNIAQGPDGNGSSLFHFYKSSLCKQWSDQGVRYVNFVLVDNPLADPFDAELLGYHQRQQAEATVKCTWRQNATEKVGVLTKREGKTHVIEYSEIPETERLARQPDGELLHRCANLSLFCFNMDFIAKAAKDASTMPLHAVFKNVEAGKELKAWKFEMFIFDILPLARHVEALLYPREACFAPLKNLKGEGSLETVQQALITRDRQILSEITQTKLPNQPFEIAQDFYYPTPEINAKWKGKTLSPSIPYVEP